MIGRIYTIRGAPTAIAANMDILEILPASGKPIIVHNVKVTPVTGEENQQFEIRVKILTATVTSGSGGSTPTIGPNNSHSATAGFAVEAFNSTQASTNGSTHYQDNVGVPSQAGYEYLPDIAERPVVHAGEAFVVSSVEAAGVSGLWTITAVVAEL